MFLHTSQAQHVFAGAAKNLRQEGKCKMSDVCAVLNHQYLCYQKQTVCSQNMQTPKGKTSWDRCSAAICEFNLHIST